MNITVLNSTLRDLCSDDMVFDYPYGKVWNLAGISLRKRLTNSPDLENVIRETLKTDNLKNYIVAVDMQSPTRCIDGRKTKGWKPAVDSSNARSLGPKVAGGTPHAALTHRIVDVENLRADLKFEDDIRYVVDQYTRIGIGFGGHLDDHATGWNTGCGAVDNINKILEKLQLPEPQQQIRALTRIILGDSYEGHHVVNEIIGRMLYLDALKPRYMPKENDDPQGEFLYKKTLTGLLREQASSSHENVPQLTGSHNEVAAVLNFNHGTTFDTDRFSYDNKNEIQVFAWDIWEMYEEAERLYPYTMRMSVAAQKEAIRKRTAHVTTRTLLGIATTMVLTDGSLIPVIIKE